MALTRTEKIIEETSDYTLVKETFTDEVGAVQAEGRRLDWKAGSAVVNAATLDSRLDAMKQELRDAIVADRALRDRAQAARQAIPAAGATTVANLRTAIMESLAIDADAATARMALDRAILNIVRFQRSDFTQVAE